MLHQVTVGSRFERFVSVCGTRVRCKEQQLCAGYGLSDPACSIEAVHDGHRNVQENQIRFHLLCRMYQCQAIPERSYNLVGFFQKLCNAAGKQWMIVSDQQTASPCRAARLCIGAYDVAASRERYRTVHFKQRYANKDSSSGTKLRFNSKGSIHQLSALAHAVQAQPGFLCGRIKADAGICDAQLKPLTYQRQLHLNISGVCMLGDVS